MAAGGGGWWRMVGGFKAAKPRRRWQGRVLHPMASRLIARVRCASAPLAGWAAGGWSCTAGRRSTLASKGTCSLGL